MKRKNPPKLGLEVLTHLYHAELDNLPDTLSAEHLANSQSQSNLPLANHLFEKTRAKIKMHLDNGRKVSIYGPDWARENVEEASKVHADIIVATYGSTYALPNKIPEENAKAITSASTHFYFLALDDEFVGTACLSEAGNKRAELGRAAAKRSRVGNSIIQDLRILEWLLDESIARRYKTLFTTIRTAPDRDIGEKSLMRGGQAVTSQWKKFPVMRLNGIAPLYYKHGKIEQFAVGVLSKFTIKKKFPLYIAEEDDRRFVENWLDNYGIKGQFEDPTSPPLKPLVSVGAPPKDSSIFHLVHADISFPEETEGAVELFPAVEEYFQAGTPFIQLELPVHSNSLSLQKELKENGFLIFGFDIRPDEASLLYGKVNPELKKDPEFGIVTTFWDDQDLAHPYWSGDLAAYGKKVSRSW